jgi:hypothetical protein
MTPERNSCWVDGEHLSWINDPDEAAQHPWRSGIFVFVALASFWGFFAYFGWAHRRLFEAVLIGLGFGAAGALGMLGALRRRAAAQGDSDARHAVVRLAAMWGVSLLFFVVAVLAQSVAILAIGVVVSIILSLVLRILQRRRPRPPRL